MNPFKKNGQILPIASINSMYIGDQKANDIFRPAVLIQILEDNREQLGFSNELFGEQLLFAFNDAINSEIPSIKTNAKRLAEEFGDRLASVIISLKKPSELSMNNRIDWTKDHWEFWANIERLYLVGGLTSPIMTKIFYQRIARALEENKITNFVVTFIEGSKDLGTRGLRHLCDNGEFLLFDFGQTNIKIGHYLKEDNNVVLDSILPSVKSDFLFYKYKDESELKQTALLLHEYIISVIEDTCLLTDFKGSKIKLSIANYVYNGRIYSHRGGYGKLAYLSDNYQEYLSKDLTKRLDRNIDVQLFHDTSSMALNFEETNNTAVISLGTAFGVAFVE